jgi:hypothetical protein
MNIHEQKYEWMINNSQSITCVLWPYGLTAKGYPVLNINGMLKTVGKYLLEKNLNRPLLEGYYPTERKTPPFMAGI